MSTCATASRDLSEPLAGTAATASTWLLVEQPGPWGTEALTAVYRSDDEAGTWIRINDDRHQWGWTGQAVTGDPRIHGRVYLATNGRGIQYGDPV